MARIKVDPRTYAGYGVGGRIAFSIISAPRHGRRMLRNFSSCRDFINDYIIQDYKFNKGVPVDRQYLRIIIARIPDNKLPEDELRSRMYAAKRIINMYENLAKWKRRSKLARVTFGKNADEKISHAWLLTGPSEWMKSTHLVSMVTLIFRVVVECGGFNDLETLEQVEAQFENYCTNYKKLFPTSPGNHYNAMNVTDLSVLLAPAWPKFRMLMEMYDALFRNVDHQHWNPAKMSSSWHSYGGIKSLCTFNIGVTELNAEIKGAWELWQKKKKK